jgi:hypothetical protein
MTDATMHIIEHGTPEEASDMALAQQVGAILSEVYANHPWIVSVQGQALIVRHPVIANAMTFATGREGFGSVLPKTKCRTPTELRHTVIMFGGEILEAFGLKRGAWDGSEPVVPKNWQKRGSQNTRPRFQ